MLDGECNFPICLSIKHCYQTVKKTTKSTWIYWAKQAVFREKMYLENHLIDTRVDGIRTLWDLRVGNGLVEDMVR